MGFLARRRAEKAERSYEHALSTWQQETGELKDMIVAAKDPTSASMADGQNITLQLHKGERVFNILQGASLIEPRREPGHYQGGYSGFSFRIAKGVRYHVGGSRGTFTQGAEVPTPIDTGTVTITDQRVVFQGTKQAREWTYDKMLGYQNDARLPWTSIQVSNRQKVSGFLYDKANTVAIRFRLALAIACHQGKEAEFLAHLERELDEHNAVRPTAPALPASGKTCPKCGAANPADAHFCGDCGTKI